VPLGRLAGIPISVHVTFVLLIALVAFESAQPGGLGVVDGVIWVVLIFACVVVHELAHSLLAQRRGAVVKSIMLLPFGGVSRIDRMPENWSDEFQIAAAGPAASLLLSAGFSGLAVLFGLPLLPVTLTGGALLPRLAWTNLLLGLFNLVPAFPLDGGRVLRATLERRHDPETATHIAARLGRALAAGMVLIGLLWNLWIAFTGVFVYLGATQEEQATTIHVRLWGRPVRWLMRHPVATIDARQSLGSVINRWPGPMVVTLDGHYYGMVNGTDIAGGDRHLTVADITDRDAPTLSPEEDLGRSALDRIVTSGYTALAVVDQTAVVGVLSLDDVARWVEQEQVGRRAA
jgi:Zn-dependent protease